MEKVLLDWQKPGHPTAYAGLSTLGRFYKGRFSQAQLKQGLSSIDAYTIKREAKKPIYNPIIVTRKRELLQADLIDVQQLSKLEARNQSFRYILCAIDTLTRYAVCLPLKDKQMSTLHNALIKVFRRFGMPKKSALLVDRGSEFVNSRVKSLLKANNIELRHPSYKASHVERFQRSLQSLIYRYIEQTQNNAYISVLPELVRSYNNRYHRSIKMTPVEAEDDANYDQLLQTVTDNYARIRRKKPKLKMGQKVRLQYERKTFQRSYTDIYGEEVFRIAKIHTALPRPMYSLVDLLGRTVDRRRYYAEQLQPVTIPDDIYKVAGSPKKRRRNKKTGVKEAFVR